MEKWDDVWQRQLGRARLVLQAKCISYMLNQCEQGIRFGLRRNPSHTSACPAAVILGYAVASLHSK